MRNDSDAASGRQYDRDALPSAERGPIVIRSQAAPPTEFREVHDLPEEPGFDLREYWRTVLKHRWIVAGCIAAFLVAAVVATLLMTPIFSARTTIQIDREASKVVDMEGVAPAELMTGDEFFRTQYGLLKSEALATRVVERLRLGEDNAFAEAMGVNPRNDATPAQRKQSAINLVMRNLGVSPVQGSRLVVLTFDSPNPALSARVANAVADSYVETNLERAFEASSYARKFLEGRIAEVKQRLEESEKQLVAYAAQQQIVNVGVQSTTDGNSTASQSLTASSLSDLNTALAAASGERIRAEQRWRQAQATPDTALPEALANPTVQQLQQERARLNSVYTEKRKVMQPNFPEMLQLKAQIDEIDRQLAAIVGGIRGSIRAQYETALKQEQSFEGRVAQLKGSYLDLRERSIQYNILQREVDTNRVLYDGLLQRYKEVGIAGAVGANNVSIVDVAKPPPRPSKPSLPLNLAVALLLGVIVGVSAAFLAELFDDAIAVPEDVESKLGLSVLGVIPALDKSTTPDAAMQDPRSAFSESYYSLRTALQFSTHGGVPRSLLVTSSKPAEGKSTTSQAIARFFARSGLQVLLIDADLRNPSQHRTMRTDNSIGLSNYLVGADLSDVIHKTEQPGLCFIPSGPLAPNPAELLVASRLHALLAQAGEHFDLVVLDGPPVLGLSDSPALAYAAAATIMVVESAKTRRGMARAALGRLRLGQARMLGVVLTKFRAKVAGYGYGYGYDYAYTYDYGKPEALAKAS
ncbi:MAG: GumC family protein [Caulobacter sp.]|jgi:capsular exopolysaccharide synthesis family protein